MTSDDDVAGRGSRPMMKAGITLPQGCDREYLGVEPRRAWDRTVRSPGGGRRVGFESLWLTTTCRSTRRPRRLRSSILSSSCPRWRWLDSRRPAPGHLVLAAAYRPAGLTAKMITTLDVVSGGRVELGIGAGWKQDEWCAYGYGFPVPRRSGWPSWPTTSRSSPGCCSRGRSRSRGGTPRHGAAARARRISAAADTCGPVGGNGPNVTWRLAARFADELNLDALPPATSSGRAGHPRRAVRRSGATRPTLRVSVHIWGAADAPAGPPRRDRLRAYKSLGLARAIVRDSRR